jgi:hypothetical protein
VDVDGAVRCSIQHGLRKDQSVRRDDKRLRLRCPNPRDAGFALEMLRLIDLEALRLRQALYRAGDRAQAPAGRTIRLRENQRNVVTGVHKTGQSPLGELRGARED